MIYLLAEVIIEIRGDYNYVNIALMCLQSCKNHRRSRVLSMLKHKRMNLIKSENAREGGRKKETQPTKRKMHCLQKSSTHAGNSCFRLLYIEIFYSPCIDGANKSNVLHNSHFKVKRPDYYN